MEKSAMKRYFEEVITQMEYIDVLINGATLCKESDIDATIAVNLTGLINTTTTVLPYMDKSKEGRGGLIVNIASVTGLDPSPVFCVYSAAKFGVIGFTRSLAVSLCLKYTFQMFENFTYINIKMDLKITEKEIHFKQFLNHLVRKYILNLYRALLLKKKLLYNLALL